MTIDWVEGRIDGAQANMDPVYVHETISTMKHGAIAYIETEAFWADHAENNHALWVDGNSPRYEESDVPKLAIDISDFVRCIRIKTEDVDGFVIDASSLNFVPNGTIEEKVLPRSGPCIDDPGHTPLRLPVVAWVGNTMELEMLTGIIKKQFNIELGACALAAHIASLKVDED